MHKIKEKLTKEVQCNEMERKRGESRSVMNPGDEADVGYILENVFKEAKTR